MFMEHGTWNRAMAEDSNNRRSTRRRTLFGGVVYDEDRKAWECSVSDFSEEGVKVRMPPDSVLEIGDFVDLKINKFNDLRRCKVMWARDGFIGLQFLIKIDRVKDGMTDFFKIMEKP